MSTQTIKHIISIAAFIVACFCAIAGLYLPPAGSLDPSILYLTALFLVFIASILGLDLNFSFGNYGFRTKAKINYNKEEDKEE